MRYLALLVVFACLNVSPSAAEGLRKGLFQSLEVPSNPAREVGQWRRFFNKYRNEQAVYAMCGSEGSLCSPALHHWRRLVSSLKGRPARQSLDKINSTINALVEYRADGWQPGRKDQWASPLESIANGGDCEDIAILKYISLMELGFSERNLRLVIVRDMATGRAHALLAVNLKGRNYILDNLSNEVRPERNVKTYLPLYSISGKSRWLHLAYRRVANAG